MKCKKCHHSWKPRKKQLPERCPRCKNTKWMNYSKKEHLVNQTTPWSNIIYGKFILSLSDIHGLMALQEGNLSACPTQQDLSKRFHISQPRVSKILTQLDRYVQKERISKRKSKYLINPNTLVQDFLRACIKKVCENIESSIKYLESRKEKSKGHKKAYSKRIIELKSKIKIFNKIDIEKESSKKILIEELENCLWEISNDSLAYNKELSIFDIFNAFILSLPERIGEDFSRIYNIPNIVELAKEYRKQTILGFKLN